MASQQFLIRRIGIASLGTLLLSNPIAASAQDPLPWQVPRTPNTADRTTSRLLYPLKLADLPKIVAQANPANADDPAFRAGFEAGSQLFKQFEQQSPDALRQTIIQLKTLRQFARLAGNFEGELFALIGLGFASNALSENQQAITYFEELRSLAKAKNNILAEVAALFGSGKVYLELGNNQQALAHFEQALPLGRKLDNPQFEAGIHLMIGFTYIALDNDDRALPYLEQALPLSRTANDRQIEAAALFMIGKIYLDASNNEQALYHFEQALPLSRETSNLHLEAATLLFMSRVSLGLDNFEQALAYSKQAMSLIQNTDDLELKANIINQLANCYSRFGNNKRQALDYYNKALSLSRAIDNRRQEATILNNIGEIYSTLGESQKALDYFNQALSLHQAIGNRSGEATALTNIGSVYGDSGDYQQVLNYQSRALSLSQEVGNPGLRAGILDNIAATYGTLGEFQRSLDYLNQSLASRRTTNDRWGEALTLLKLGIVSYQIGGIRQSLDYFEQALPLSQSANNRRVEAFTLSSLGIVRYSLNEPQQALDYLNQALQLSQTLEDRSGEAVALAGMGVSYHLLGNHQQALTSLNRSLQLSQTIGNRNNNANWLLTLAALEYDQGKFNESLAHIEESLSIIESQRNEVASQDLRVAFFASKQKSYDLYVNLLMQLHQQEPSRGYDALALQASERARARSLLDLLNEARADIRQGVDPALRERERELLLQIAARTKAQVELLRRRHTHEQAEAIRLEIDDLQVQLQAVEKEIRTTSPRYAALTQPQPLSLTAIQNQVVDAETILLSYWLGNERSYLWAVTPDSLNTYELPKRSEIETAAQNFYQHLTVPELRDEPRLVEKASAELGQMLLGPVAHQLEQKRILVVGNGSLQRLVPFGALSDPRSSDSKPLLVEHEIVSAPSASALVQIRRDLRDRQPATRTVAVLADPVFDAEDVRVKGRVQPAKTSNKPTLSLPSPSERVSRDMGLERGEALFPRLRFSRQEAEALAQLVPDASKPLLKLDFEASRETAISPQLNQYRYVHLATHGFYNDVRPELSGIALSLVNEQGEEQEGLLLTSDVFNLDLPAELVVLSACRTGLGKEVRGEGIMGLTRGLMYAGAARVVVSLWSVEDEATSVLMAEFYRGILQEGLTPAQALRAAQLSMWQERRTKSPYYWAAFVLQGEWR